MNVLALILSLAASAAVPPTPVPGPIPLLVTDKQPVSEVETFWTVDGKTSTVPPKGYVPEREYRVVLQNLTDQDIVAWSFSCLYVRNDGNSSLAGTRHVLSDIFDPADSPNTIPAGGTHEMRVPENTSMITDGPFGAMSCRVDAALLRDGTGYGDLSVMAPREPAPAIPRKLDSTGCEVSGTSPGGAGVPCAAPSTYAELTYHISANCRNPCTGATWTVRSDSATITGNGGCTCPAFLAQEEMQYELNGNIKIFQKGYSGKGTPSTGCFFNAPVEAFTHCKCPGCGDPDDPTSPILLSLKDSHYQLTSAADGVHFDLNGDGVAEQTAWTSADGDDGFLALDRNGNGTIDDFREIFGNTTPQFPSDEPNGWLALAIWDDLFNGGNEDGFINGEDTIFSSLRIWVDKNHNGFSEPSELLGLEEAGVVALSLDYKVSERRDRHDNLFRYAAPVRMKMRMLTAWDVFFQAE